MDMSQYNLNRMSSKNGTSLKNKLLRAGGWQVAKRLARSLPFGGSLIAIALVGSDISRKGVVRGVLNSGIDAIPFVGLAKNGIELVTGDLFADKEDRKTK